MNQSKFSLADVLTVVGGLAFGYGCFLGNYLFTLGNTKQSIILSGIIFLLLCGTALGAKLLKCTSRNFKTSFIWEMILLISFTAFTFYFAYSPFSHYFTVSAQKDEIQKKLIANIEQVENMFPAYEQYTANRENLYNSTLRSVASAKSFKPGEYDAHGFVNNISDQQQIKNKMGTLHADLFPSNYSDTGKNNGTKEVATIWLADAKNKVATWKPISVVSIVNEVEQNSIEWLTKLITLSSVREKQEQYNDFQYALSFESIKEYFTTPGRATLLSIGLAIIAYLTMLLSYLFAKRSTKTIVGTSKRKGNFDIEY